MCKCKARGRCEYYDWEGDNAICEKDQCHECAKFITCPKFAENMKVCKIRGKDGKMPKKERKYREERRKHWLAFIELNKSCVGPGGGEIYGHRD